MTFPGEVALPKQAPFDPIQLANTFVERFGKTRELDHLKLQKLAYYAYGWWLALRQLDPPLTTAKPQVWKLGPVFRPIYAAFASHRAEPIVECKRPNPFAPAGTIPREEAPGSQVVDWIWGRYGHLSGIQLSEMTHEVGTPWHNKAKAHNFVVPQFLELTDDEIRPYFRDMAIKEGLIREDVAAR